MRHQLEIDSESYAVEVTAQDGQPGWEVTVDGQAHPIDIRQVGPGRLQLRLEGRWLDCWVVRSARGTWVWAGGRARLVRETRGRRPGAAGGQGQQVTPTMPAVVMDIQVELGQRVKRGDALVVVSAMKMETTLVAPHGGVVAAVHTQPGAKVIPGDVLVEIQPDPPQEGEHD